MKEAALNVVKMEEGQVLSVKLPKRFTFDDNHRFHTIVETIRENGGHDVIFEMGNTEFMDSAGLGMLLLARDEVSKVGKTISIRGPQPYVKKLLTISRFYELFKIED